MPDTTLYEQDFYAWSLEQAALLRAGQVNAADLEHIAEEIESMGKAEKRELTSRLIILLLHLLKWEHQPTHRGPSWRLSIANARDDLTDLLTDNPSLKAQRAAALDAAYRRARRQAAVETNRPESAFPDLCPYGFEQALDPDFWPDRV